MGAVQVLDAALQIKIIHPDLTDTKISNPRPKGGEKQLAKMIRGDRFGVFLWIEIRTCDHAFRS